MNYIQKLLVQAGRGEGTVRVHETESSKLVQGCKIMETKTVITLVYVKVISRKREVHL